MTCPFPRYWICHALIALVIAAVIWPVFGLTAGLLTGIAFYAGREITQWEQGGGPGLPFDWPGFLAPALVNAAVLIIGKIIG